VSPQTSSSPALRELFDRAGSCAVTAEQTEGPYYFDADAIRSDIREDRAGVPLRLAVRVQRVGACTPVPNDTDRIARGGPMLTLSAEGDGYLGLVTIGAAGL